MKTRVCLTILLAALVALPAIAQYQSSGVENPSAQESLSPVHLLGSWTLHYDWSCSGSYGSTPITFNAGGTFSSPPYTGHWSQHDGQIVWRFDQGGQAVYGGTAIDNAMAGISTTFAGLNGCWYALRVGTSSPPVEPVGEFDAAGNKNE